MGTILFLFFVAIALFLSEVLPFFEYNWHQSYFDDAYKALLSLQKGDTQGRSDLVFELRERLDGMSANLMGIWSNRRFIQFAERQKSFSDYLKNKTPDLSSTKR